MQDKIKEYSNILISEIYFKNNIKRKYELNLPVKKEILDNISKKLESSLTWYNVLFPKHNNLFEHVNIYKLNTFIEKWNYLSIINKKKIDFLLNEYTINEVMENYESVIVLEKTTIISIAYDMISSQKFISKFSIELIKDILEYYGCYEYKHDVFIYNHE